MGQHLRGSAQGLTPPGEPTPTVFTIHSFAHGLAAARAAAEAGRPILLLSAPDAGIYAGPGWFKALIEAVQEAIPEAEFSAILDCGGDAGAAMAAIRAGIDAIVFTGRSDVAARLAGIAEAANLRILNEPPAASLDLARFFFADPETLRHRCSEAIPPRASC